MSFSLLLNGAASPGRLVVVLSPHVQRLRQPQGDLREHHHQRDGQRHHQTKGQIER
jgi:hypothetical protein